MTDEATPEPDAATMFDRVRHGHCPMCDKPCTYGEAEWGDELRQPAWCDHCGQEWVELYEQTYIVLDGERFIEPPDKPPDHVDIPTPGIQSVPVDIPTPSTEARSLTK